MAANRPCECGICVFGRQPELSDYQCDREQLVSDLGHAHDALRYVSGHVSVRCSECDERLAEGALRCQHPNCVYALCLQCAPKQFAGACWDSNQFVNQELCSEFECVLCSNICKQIVELQCGHTFGKHCLQRMMQAQPAPHKCPLCQTKFNPDMVSPSWSNRLKILSLDAHCCHQASGCNFRGTLAAVVRHQLSQCGYRRVTCTLPGCHADFALLEQIDHHQLHCQVQCPAPDCGQRFTRSQLVQHVLEQHLPRLEPDRRELEGRLSEAEKTILVLKQENQRLQQLVDSQQKQEEKKEVRDVTSIGSMVRYLPVFVRNTVCRGVAVSGGRLYLSNSSNYVVDVVDAASGDRVSQWGRYGQRKPAVGQPPRFKAPYGVAVDERRDRLYVADDLNHCVVVLRLCDGLVEAVWGSEGTGQQEFSCPRSLAYCPATDLLYVADRNNHCVKVLRGLDGQCMLALRSKKTFAPAGVAVDNNHIYIADTYNHRVWVFFKLTSTFLFQIGQGEGSGDTQFYYPRSVSVDSEAGVVYVADTGNHRVCVYRSGDGSFVRHFQVLQADNIKGRPSSVMWDAAAGVLYVTILESTAIYLYGC